MDIENLDAGQEFRELSETYTIFILEKDFYNQGEPVYLIERMNITTGKPFEDGEHIVYVNGEYRGDSAIGKLMHDFNCTKADDMNYELMAERTRYLKESQKGIQEMCQIMEDMRNEALEEGRKEGIKEAAINTAKRMIKRGKATLEEIAEDTGLTLSKIEELSANINKL